MKRGRMGQGKKRWWMEGWNGWREEKRKPWHAMAVAVCVSVISIHPPSVSQCSKSLFFSIAPVLCTSRQAGKKDDPRIILVGGAGTGDVALQGCLSAWRPACGCCIVFSDVANWNWPRVWPSSLLIPPTHQSWCPSSSRSYHHLEQAIFVVGQLLPPIHSRIEYFRALPRVWSEPDLWSNQHTTMSIWAAFFF